MWWYTCVIPEPGKWRQEDHKFSVNLQLCRDPKANLSQEKIEEIGGAELWLLWPLWSREIIAQSLHVFIEPWTSNPLYGLSWIVPALVVPGYQLKPNSILTDTNDLESSQIYNKSITFE